MKKLISRTLILAMALGLASFAFAGDAGSWTGTVTDSICGGKAHDAACAVKCVKEKGAKYALYTPGDKGVWVLSNQAEAEKMAGKEVTVKGTLDKEKKSITVASMEPAAAPKK